MMRRASSPYRLGLMVFSPIRKLPFNPALALRSFRNMLQLVGIAHDVDHSDFVGDDFECNREDVTLGESCHASRQPVDCCGIQVNRRVLPLTSYTGKERQYLGAADDG